MTVYHIAYIFLFILFIISKIIKSDDISRKFFCISTGIVYFFIAAFRGYRVGCDTYTYYYGFMDASKAESLSEYMDRFSESERKDYFYNAFIWLMRQLTDNFTWVLVIVAALFAITFWRLIYKYSKDPCLSIIFILAFNIYQFTLTGIRQTIAISLLILAYERINKNKYISCVLLILIAAQFHKSAYIFLIILLLKFVKIKYNSLLAMALTALATLIFRNRIASLLMPLVEDRGYSLSLSGGGETMLFVIFAIFVFCVVVLLMNKNNIIEKYSFEICISFMALFFEILVPTQNIFFRLAFYFLVFFSLLLPNVIDLFEGKNKIAVNVATYAILSVQYVFFTIISSGIGNYVFFWE